MNSTRLRVAVTILLGLHVLASLWSASRESATWDEPSHVGAGYAYAVLGNYQLKPIAAPFVMWLAGAASLTLEPAQHTHPSLFNWSADRFGYALLYGEEGNEARLHRARLLIVVLSVLLGLSVFQWARELWGPGAALAALFLYAASPAMLAHSHYLTLDLPMALMSTLFLWGLWRFLGRPSLWHGIWVSLALGMTVVTKYSFPVILAMAAAVAVLRVVQIARRSSAASAARMAQNLLFLTGLSMLVAWLMVWAGFAFRFRASPAPQTQTPATLGRLAPETPLDNLLSALLKDRVVPEGFVQGLATTAALQQKTVMAYLGGLMSTHGWWYYLPITFLLKTPLPLLFLLAVTPFLAKLRDQERQDLQYLALGAGVYLGLAMYSRLSIGYRHLLPCIPLLFVWAGWSVKALWRTTHLAWLSAGLLLWYGLSVRVAPHFLSYFNEAAGGPDGGHQYLVDSNTDWGQDLDELARLCPTIGVDSIKLSYFGSASPDAAGISYEALPSVTCCWKPRHWASKIETGDVVAVSVTNLRGVYFRLPGRSDFPVRVQLEDFQQTVPLVDFFAYLDASYRPFARAGHTILLYRLLPEYRR